jgi:hypothetical protein
MISTNIDNLTQIARASERSTRAHIGAAAATGLFAALMTVSGIFYLVGPRFIMEQLEPLGYPLYFLKMLGAAKLLGVVGLLVPKRPTIREWAYAGFTFDLVAAVVSHLATNGAAHVPPALVALALLFTSYVLRRRIGTGANT